jgi:hypothetical protein
LNSKYPFLKRLLRVCHIPHKETEKSDNLIYELMNTASGVSSGEIKGMFIGLQ